MGGVIASNFVHAPVLSVALAAGSFVGTYLSVRENGEAIPQRARFFDESAHLPPSLN